jgi:hypothetical protein
MGQEYRTLRNEFLSTIDPRVTATFGLKGALYRFAPAVGVPEVLQKQSDGTGVDWVAVGGGGGTPTGNPETVAFYNAGLGDLDTTLGLGWDETLQNFVVGAAIVGNGNFGPGTNSIGVVSSSGGGLATTGAAGNIIHGFVSGATGLLTAFSNGQFVGGVATDGVISGDPAAEGAFAHGIASTSTSLITATNTAAFVQGRAGINGTLQASGIGAVVHGSASGNLIQAASIIASGTGAVAFGNASGGLTTILASGNGSFAMGNVTTAANALAATGLVSWAIGIGHTVSGDYATSFGQDNLNSSYACLMVGRFGDGAGTPGAWVSTEAAFIVGAGTSSVARANAYRVDKDGRTNQTAAEVHAGTTSFSGAGVVNLSARTDRFVLCDTAIAPVTVNLPAGEEGLEFIIKDAEGNAAANNISIVAAGGDVVDAALTAIVGAVISTNGGVRHLIFSAKYGAPTWWVVAFA